MSRNITQATPDYYEILQVSHSASPEIIQAAYRLLVNQWQSDRKPDDSSAFNRLAMLDMAHSVLSDAQQRERYDTQRKLTSQFEADKEERTPSLLCEITSPSDTSSGCIAPRLPGTIGPIAWSFLTIGAVLFLLHMPPDILFIVSRSVIWGLCFGVPVYLMYRKKRRTGITVVAGLFFLAAGLDVVVEHYTQSTARTLQTRVSDRTRPIDEVLSTAELADKSDAVSSGKEWRPARLPDLSGPSADLVAKIYVSAGGIPEWYDEQINPVERATHFTRTHLLAGIDPEQIKAEAAKMFPLSRKLIEQIVGIEAARNRGKSVRSSQ